MNTTTWGWWEANLDIAKWNSRKIGARDVHAGCPVHGGSDSLHVTETRQGVKAHCFACQADTGKVVEALESPGSTTPTVKVKGSRKDTSDQKSSPGSSGTSVDDPVAWYADYIGVDETFLRSLGVSASPKGWVRHGWHGHSGVYKDREPKGSKAQRLWINQGRAPKLWPMPDRSLPSRIYLCEGETDTIVARYLGNEAFTSGGASNLLEVTDLRRLAEMGVEEVVIAFDQDDAGNEGARELSARCLRAGLDSWRLRWGDPIIEPYKDLRDWWLIAHRDELPAIIGDADDYATPIAEIEPVEDMSLWLERIHPMDHTVLFGDGGTGKGVIAAWWAARLSQEHDLNILVVDYERHARHEWRPRYEHFGGDMSKMWVMQPIEAIWDEVERIRTVIQEREIDLVIVDSITYACLGEEVEKSATAAKYSVAIAQFGTAVLSLAHQTKSNEDPKHPFGSVFWSNGARVTIAVTNDSATGPRRLECKKTNQAAPFEPVQIDWEWVTSALPDTLKESAGKVEIRKGPSVAKRILEVITENPMDTSGLRVVLGDIEYKTLTQTLSRMSKNGEIERSEDGEWYVPDVG